MLDGRFRNFCCLGACGAMPPADTGGSSSSNVKLVALLCDGPALAVGTVTAGNCFTFESSEDTPVRENEWSYIGFTFDVFNNRGTFVVNGIHGYQSETNTAMENKFFAFDTKQWLGLNALGVGSTVRIGGRKHENSADAQSFTGKMSCLQVYNQFLRPSQIQHIKKCPVGSSYSQFKLCPSGFKSFRGLCYQVQSKAKVFSDAEHSCATKRSKLKVKSKSQVIIPPHSQTRTTTRCWPIPPTTGPSTGWQSWPSPSLSSGWVWMVGVFGVRRGWSRTRDSGSSALAVWPLRPR